MKSFLCILTSFLLLLTISGCQKRETIDESKIADIVLVQIRENYAWGRQQHVTVTCADGSQRSRSVSTDVYTDGRDNNTSVGWVDLKADGWYEALLDIAENGDDEGECPSERLDSARRNATNFAEWNGLPYKDYGEIMMDYGTNTLYGVYLADNAEPRLIWLAAYGDNPCCVDNSQAMKFVNGLKMFDYKFK